MDFEFFTMVPMWVLVHLRCCSSKLSTRSFSQVWLETRWIVRKFEPQLYCWLPTVEIWRIWNFYSNKFYPWHRSIFHVENFTKLLQKKTISEIPSPTFGVW